MLSGYFFTLAWNISYREAKGMVGGPSLAIMALQRGATGWRVEGGRAGR